MKSKVVDGSVSLRRRGIWGIAVQKQVESCGQLAESEKPKTGNPDPFVKWSSRLQAARTWVREHPGEF